MARHRFWIVDDRPVKAVDGGDGNVQVHIFSWTTGEFGPASGELAAIGLQPPGEAEEVSEAELDRRVEELRANSDMPEVADWVESIRHAFGDAVDGAEAERVYDAWIRQCTFYSLKPPRAPLEHFAPEMVVEALEEKVEEIEATSPAERHYILAADRIEIELDAIDTAAESWAFRVHRGEPLDPAERQRAQGAQGRLRQLAEELSVLPRELVADHLRRVSESTLDLNLALTGDSSIMSLRMGHTVRPDPEDRLPS
jgi:hypothetical protein